MPAVDGEEIVIDLDDYLIDPNGDSLTITPDSLPAGVNFDATTNELTFTPTVDNVGDTVASFIVDDGNGGSTPATVTIQPVNPVPDAVIQTTVTTPNTPVLIDPLFNDMDPDGDPLEISVINGELLTPGVAQTISVPNGTVNIATDGKITVTPNTGFAGDIDVPYTIVDQDGATASNIHRVVTGNAPPEVIDPCLLYTSPSPRDATLSRMPSSA